MLCLCLTRNIKSLRDMMGVSLLAHMQKQAPTPLFLNNFIFEGVKIMARDGNMVRTYMCKLKRARSYKSKQKYTAMIDNLVGYAVIETGKSGEQIRKEWGLKSYA